MFFVIICIFLCLVFLALQLKRSEARTEQKIQILLNRFQLFANKMAEKELEKKRQLLEKVRRYEIAPDDLRNINLR